MVIVVILVTHGYPGYSWLSWLLMAILVILVTHGYRWVIHGYQLVIHGFPLFPMQTKPYTFQMKSVSLLKDICATNQCPFLLPLTSKGQKVEGVLRKLRMSVRSH